MASVRTSFLWALGQNYVVLGCQFVTSIVIARLLTPAEMGVFSVAVVIVGLAQVLRDFGVGDYIVQEKELTRDRIRSALTVNIVLAWSLAAVLFVGSWPAAAFYRDAGVQSVMQVLSINFLLLPFGSVPLAVVRREMNFAVIAEVRIVTTLVGSATSITLAYLGMSYLSMAWGSVVSNLLVIVIAWRHRPDGLPFLPGVGDVRRVMRFGSFVSATFLLSELDKSASDLLLGRLLGMSATGLFGRAQGLVQLMDRILMGSVWSVALPFFAQKERGGGDVREGFLKTAGYLTVLMWPFAIFLGFMAYPAIRIMFGPQWDAAVPLVRWLCLHLIVAAPFALLGSVMLAIGRVRALTLGVSANLACKVGLLLIGASYGLEQVAMAVVGSTIVGSVISFTLLRRSIGLRMHLLMNAVWRSGVVSALSAIGPAAVYFMVAIGPERLWWPVGVAILTAFLGWVGGVILVTHPIKAELETMWRRLSGKRLA